jgi:hypothetical protein
MLSNGEVKKQHMSNGRSTISIEYSFKALVDIIRAEKRDCQYLVVVHYRHKPTFEVIKIISNKQAS